MMGRVSALFMVFIFGLMAKSPVQADEPMDYAYIDARIELLMQRDDMMGLGVAIVENGNIRFVRGYGLTEAGGAPVNTSTRFRWASVSKGLAGSLAAQLDHEGALSLDDKLSSYDTSLRLPGLGEEKASVAHLLSHRLGIGSRAYNGKLEAGQSPQLIRASLSSVSPVCPIGNCFTYQNVAFDAISEVFFRATGESFAGLAQRKVFRPLRMNDTVLTYSELIQTGNYARPHSWSRSERKLNKDGVTLPYFEIPSAAGVSSSITDLARFLQAQTGARPSVFHPDALTIAQTLHIETPETQRKIHAFYPGVQKAGYGLGWRIYDYRGHKLIGHEGVLRGMRALILFDPELKTGIVAVWNSNVSRPTGLQFEVMDMAYGLPKRDWMRLYD